LCAGIRDAGNLAWKLELVLRHGAPDALLDSYEQERKPHVRALVATAKDFGHIIGELDPAAARIRDETLRGQLERGEAETIRQRFVPDLTTGIIDRDPAASGAGSLFVQPMVRRHTGEDASGEGVLLDDLLQFRFLIATSTVQAQTWLTPESHELWRRLGGERIVIGPPELACQPDDVACGDIQYLSETNGLFAAWMSQHGSVGRRGSPRSLRVRNGEQCVAVESPGRGRGRTRVGTLTGATRRDYSRR
jgi:3-(3-hydroxy-phenyl)propionate hydroxylase